MLQLFFKGGPMMWPLLAASLVTLTVVVERVLFILRENASRDPTAVEAILSYLEEGDIRAAVDRGQKSRDFVARTVVYALERHHRSYSSALLRAAGQELERYNRNLSILDTVITLAPLLGLLGTVTGMIHAFGLLGQQELGTPIAITGGIAQALIATAFGLGIAITALIPFNYLNSRMESARRELEDISNQLEILFTGRESGAVP